MNRYKKYVTVPLGFLACGAFGFFLRDIQSGKAPSTESVGRLFGVKAAPATMTAAAVFRTNYNRIMTDYERPLRATDLRYAGIGGMLAALGDPHTVFLPPRAAQDFSDETTAKFFGVGARLGPDPLGAKAAEVFEDGPAYRAGLRKGAIITSVDGKSVTGVEIDGIVRRIKGPEGTIVRIGVMQNGSSKPVTLVIRRGRITTPTVTGDVLSGSRIGYLAVSQFSEPTATQFDRQLSKLEAQGIRGLVIDLRGNPGGLLTTAADMLGRFVDDKPVVTMKFRNGTQEVQRSSSSQVHAFRYPVAVLTDEDSASAAEIFAGCLKDYGKATLVGGRTYGKASVQNVFPLIDNSSAKVTIAKYYLPSSGYIGRKVDEDGVMVSGGLEPDVKVTLTTDVLVTLGDPKTDNQLAKAVEVIQSKAPR
ncbi:PDZ domain-containing protein [bacterium]|nr:MAG: PDZ domain-containing protein [bacterium]